MMTPSSTSSADSPSALSSDNNEVGEVASQSDMGSFHEYPLFEFDSMNQDWNLGTFPADKVWSPTILPDDPTSQIFSLSNIEVEYSTHNLTTSQFHLEAIPPTYLPIDTLRAFPPRNIVKTGAEMSAIFIRRILGSYPNMMQRKDTFPPFIHPSCCKDDQMPEALTNCMSIVQMFSTRTKDNAKFLWRTVRMEQDRLRHEHQLFDKWELLASAQAMLIYILLRMVEGETTNTDFDIPLLGSINVGGSKS
jgi:hypothetical protein